MKTRRITLLTLLALIGLLIGGPVLAAPLAPVADAVVSWWVVASGGGSASGNNVTLDSTLGQPIAGPSSGTGVTLGAGYWYGAQSAYYLYLPDILRNAGTR